MRQRSVGRSRVVIDPELGERFLDAPGSAGLEVELIQGSKRNRLGTALGNFYLGSIRYNFSECSNDYGHMTLCLNLARPAGVEPTTYSFGNCHSIQMSYGRFIWAHSITYCLIARAHLA